MAYLIKQKNHLKPPSHDQKILMRFLGIDIPATRIDAHLLIKSTLAVSEEARGKLVTWKEIKKAQKEARNASRGATS